MTTPELTLPILETMDVDAEDLLDAALIYKISADSLMGRPVTRIELLSPTNKPPQDGYFRYRDKRNATLDSRMPLIEIDYLHQSPPVLRKMPVYPETGSHAYSIVVSDPRPSLKEGLSHLHGFDVDTPFPLIDVPLEEGEALAAFDFGIAYAATFAETPTYARVVDYAQEPIEVQTYSDADQERIKALIAEIVAQRR